MRIEVATCDVPLFDVVDVARLAAARVSGETCSGYKRGVEGKREGERAGE